MTVSLSSVSTAADRLAGFIAAHRPLLVLTGAGCSTDSGIPDYRDRSGQWKYSRPVQYDDFVRHAAVRQRYWARSMAGWPRVAGARPNPAHTALARLEHGGFIRCLVTQNVDGLHQKAGSRQVLDLHGRLDSVVCLNCRDVLPRAELQETLHAMNSGFELDSAAVAPDGDVAAEHADYSGFQVAPCPACNGTLKPDVVFFGEQVPKPRVEQAMHELRLSGGLLVVGSSLMVFSGYRFCRTARALDLPAAAVNLGCTRADNELDLKLEQPCSEVLAAAAQRLGI